MAAFKAGNLDFLDLVLLKILDWSWQAGNHPGSPDKMALITAYIDERTHKKADLTAEIAQINADNSLSNGQKKKNIRQAKKNYEHDRAAARRGLIQLIRG